MELPLDDNMEIDFIESVCAKALETYGPPEIMNSDQGSHFTSPKYFDPFLEAGSLISMDHRGRAYDNIFIERFWRTIKYENIYLQDYQSPREALAGIRQYINWYNEKRYHQSLDYQLPIDVFMQNASRRGMYYAHTPPRGTTPIKADPPRDPPHQRNPPRNYPTKETLLATTLLPSESTLG